MTHKDESKKIDAAIAQLHEDYLIAFAQWNADFEDFLHKFVLNPCMSRRAKKRWEKAQRKKTKEKNEKISIDTQDRRTHVATRRRRKD